MSYRFSLIPPPSSLLTQSSTSLFVGRNGFAPVHKAAAQNNHLSVKVFLGTPLNKELLTRDKQKMTPLLVAATYGSTSSFQVLLNSGANFSARSANGLTAIQCAVSHCHSNILLLLSRELLLVAFEEIFEFLKSSPEQKELSNCLKVLDHVINARLCVTEIDTVPLQTKILECNGLSIIADILIKSMSCKIAVQRVGTVCVQIVEKLSRYDLLLPEILTTSIPPSLVTVMRTNLETLVSAIEVLKRIEKSIILKLEAPTAIMKIVLSSQNERKREIALEGLCCHKEMGQAYFELGFLQNIVQLLSEPETSNKFLFLVFSLLEIVASAGVEVVKKVVEVGVTEILLEHFKNQSAMVTIKIISLLEKLCVSSEKAQTIVKQSNQTLQKLIHISKFCLNQAVNFQTFKIIWLLAGDSDKEKTGLASLLGPACILQVMSVGGPQLQYITITMLRLLSPDVYGLQSEIGVAGGVASLLKVVRLAGGALQLEALLALENLSHDIAMRVNKETQESVLKMDGIQLLLRLYLTAKDEKLKLQSLCTLAAVSVGNLNIKKTILSDPKFSLKELVDILYTSQCEATVLRTAMKAVSYLAYNSIDTQVSICEARRVPVEPFRKLLWGRDRFASTLAAFHLVVLVRVLEKKEDKTAIVAECVRLLVSELELALHERNISLQVHLCSLLAAVLRVRVGLPNAVLATGVASTLAKLLTSELEQSRRTAAIVLCYLTHTPKGSRTILSYCRRTPRLFHLLRRHCRGYTLSVSFLEGWEHYRSTHLRGVRGRGTEEAELVAAPLSEAKVFGCYDGQLYVFSTDNGSLHWTFNTSPDEGEPLPIKSSPCVDPASGHLWFGSHDHHMYAIDIHSKCLVHKVYLGGGSCFAAPCVGPGVLYCASLQGRVAAINTVSGEMEWTYQCPKPVFSSPNYVESRRVILTGCVDGGVYVLDQHGELVTVLCTQDAVFSSCTVLESDSTMDVVCGSHDNHMHCWNHNYELSWKTGLDSSVYSTPCPVSLSCTSLSESKTSTAQALCVCSSTGCLYIVNPYTGFILGSYNLPGSVFSSPVVYEQSVIVGCRDNYVYCIDLHLGP